jgi:rRNA-processing protein FCF1
MRKMYLFRNILLTKVKKYKIINLGIFKNSIKTMEDNMEDIQTQLQEEYLKSLEQLEEGGLYEGTIIKITQDQVYIDIGNNIEGKIPISEFSQIPNIGDTVSVILFAKENKYGEVIISKQKADIKIFWKNLHESFKNKNAIKSIIEREVNGGYIVNLGYGVHAFLPAKNLNIGDEYFVFVESLYSNGKININVKIDHDYLLKEREKKFDDNAILWNNIIKEKENCKYIFDTNILMNYPELLLVIANDKNKIVVIPYDVLEELDGLKNDDNENKSFHARTSLRIINEVKSKIKFESPEPELLPQGLNRRKTDNLILSIAIKLKCENIILITNDIGIKVKSEPLSIKIWDPENEIKSKI